MTDKTASQLTKELFDKVSGIKLHAPAGVFGTTSSQSMHASLVKGVAELGTALGSSEPKESVLKAFETMMGQLDTAAITGLISELEAAEYYRLADSIWAAIEKENVDGNN